MFVTNGDPASNLTRDAESRDRKQVQMSYADGGKCCTRQVLQFAPGYTEFL